MTDGTSARMKRPTQRDVAERSGVSRATVSYVLNEDPRQSIPLATRRRVLDAAAALGFSPSAAAVALRRGHSNIVLIVKDSALSGYITEPFLAAISERLREAGHAPLTTDYATDEALTSLVRQLRPFGIISLTVLGPKARDALEGLGVRHQYHSFGQQDDGVDDSRPWEEMIGRAQVDHLLAEGVLRVFYAMPEEGSPRELIARARANGAGDEYRRRTGREARMMRVPVDRRLAREQIEEIGIGAEPTGVCCFDDTVAASILAAALDAGLDVPQTLSLIGVDNTPFAALMTPSITSVRIDAAATGKSVAERFLMDDQTQGQMDQHDALDIIMRETTARKTPRPDSSS